MDLRFLDLGLNLTVLGLGAPFSNWEGWAGLAKLREDEVTLFVEALQLLTQSSPKCEGLDVDFKQKHVIACLNELRKIGYRANILLQSSLGRAADALAGSAFVVASSFTGNCWDNCRGIFGSLRNFLSDKILVAQALIIDS